MPGLTFSNELISRDEALHTEFAIYLYSKLEKKLAKKKIQEIIMDAVEIEKEFIVIIILVNGKRNSLKKMVISMILE